MNKTNQINFLENLNITIQPILSIFYRKVFKSLNSQSYPSSPRKIALEITSKTFGSLQRRSLHRGNFNPLKGNPRNCRRLVEPATWEKRS